jgi:hypothetical protein
MKTTGKTSHNEDGKEADYVGMFEVKVATTN